MDLSIVMPVYNEGAGVARTINELEEGVAIPHEILIVYDFDEDDTVPVIQRLSECHKNISLVKNRYGRGVPGAIKSGFERIQSDVMVIVAADSSDDPATINEMYKKIQDGYDLVCGSRHMPGGQQLGGLPFKRFCSKLAGRSLYLITGVPTRDITNAFKMYRRGVLEEIQIESDGGFEFSMELSLKAYFKGYKIGEVPTTWRGRTVGISKFKFAKWLPKYLYWYVFALKEGLIVGRIRCGKEPRRGGEKGLRERMAGGRGKYPAA